MALHAAGRAVGAIVLAFVACAALGQSPATVNITTPTACITSLDGTPLANGTLTVFAPGQNKAPAPFSSSTGVVITGSAQRTIAAGQMVGSLTIPNPAVTSPVNIGYTYNTTLAPEFYSDSTYGSLPTGSVPIFSGSIATLSFSETISIP